MALKFSSTRRYAPSFDEPDNQTLPEDEQVTVLLNRLTVRDMFAVQKRIRDSQKATGSAKDPDKVELDFNDPEIIEEFWDLVETILVEYTNDWKNVEDDGQPVTDTKAVIDLCGPENMALPVDVFNQLLGFSQGSEDQLKNSEPESEPESLGSGSTAEAASLKDDSKSEIVEEDTPAKEDSQPSTTSEETSS